jgi:hypothetical protein
MMPQYHHRISGSFSHRNQAEKAYATLLLQGIPAKQLRLSDSDLKSTLITAWTEQGNNSNILVTVLVSGTIGTLIGVFVGMTIELAMINTSLFIASPLTVPLVLMGWGACIGGFTGIAIGAIKQRKPLARLLQKDSCQTLLTVDSHSWQQTSAAKSVLILSAKGYQNLLIENE